MSTSIESVKREMDIQSGIRELLYLASLNQSTPLPDIKVRSTLDLLEKIHADSNVAMDVSQHINDAFIKNDLRLEEDETFACMLCVVKKPKYISDVMDPTPEPALMASLKMTTGEDTSDRFPVEILNSKVNREIYARRIMEPKIMQAVFDKLENERIKY